MLDGGWSAAPSPSPVREGVGMKVWLPLDSAAVALGADEVADALLAEAQARGVPLTLVRTAAAAWSGWNAGRG